MRIAFRRCALGVAALLVAAAPALAQDSPLRALSRADINRPAVQEQLLALPETPGALFSARAAAPGERPQAAAEVRVRRARSVNLDVGYLNRMLETSPPRLDADGAISGAGQQHVLNVFDDLSVRVVKLSQTRNAMGFIVWQGGIVDDPLGSATLVVGNGDVTARIVAGGREFTIFPTGEGVHKVREVGRSSRELLDPASRPKNDARPTPPPTPEELAPPSADPDAPGFDAPERASAEPTYTIRVLVAYTPKALTDLPNMTAAVALAIADINATFTNSNISAQAQLVALERVNYTEGSTTDDDILDAATDGTGDFARISQMRAVVQADLVAVLASYATNTSCGLGWIQNTLDAVSPTASLTNRVRLGTSLTNSAGGCLPGTFTHELGHNMGAHHDRFAVTDDEPGPGAYNYGYVDTTARFMDVMAYDDECDSLNLSCVNIQYYSNPSVNYNGRPVGIADTLPAAANNSRKIRDVLPNLVRFRNFLTQPTTPMLAVFVSGSGAVTSSAGGLNCGGGGQCAASISGGGQVTLTPVAPAGYQFTGWSGACSGAGACSVSMSESRSVQATFAPSLRLATVYSSAQTQSQSFLRFANTGTTAATVNVALADAATGQALGTWTSPSIPAGAAAQYQINTIESALTPGTARPQFFAAAVQSDMTGYIQHVLYRPSDGTLTNLSTCDSGVTANATQVANVHSSILDFGFPSSIAVTNTGTSSGTATLGIFDSTNGARLGTYTTPSIPANGQAVISIATIQSSAGVTPSSTQFHYTFRIENSFSGALQHLVNNLTRGVITDMTTACAFGTVTPPASTLALRQPGPIFSSAQTASQSFLRFFNTGSTAGTVNVALANSTTGTSLGSWTSPSIPAGSSAQYQINTIESVIGSGVTKPNYYATNLQTQISGFFQHVLYRPADGTLTNLSTCEGGVASSASQLINVHSSVLNGPGFPSSVVVSNPTTAAFTATLGIFNAVTGARVGTYTTASVAAGARLIIPIATIESQIGYTPASDVFHYVIRAEGTFNGFLQHLVTNSSAGVITDMTTMCQLPATAVSYTSCTSACTITLGTPFAGQIKRPGGGNHQNFRLSLTAGTTYTINVRGSSSGNGTLVRPYIYIFGPSGGTPVADGGGGGTGNDARLTFAPTTTGNHTIQVTVYVYANNAGTFTVTVN